MRYEVSFFFGSTYLGKASAEAEQRGEFILQPASHAFFCPRCGNIWARIVSHRPPESWATWYRTCPQHTDRITEYGCGGVFTDSDLLIEEYPHDVLKHDFLTLCAIRDKLQNFPGVSP